MITKRITIKIIVVVVVVSVLCSLLCITIHLMISKQFQINGGNHPNHHQLCNAQKP